jgi:hypothetical protein
MKDKSVKPKEANLSKLSKRVITTVVMKTGTKSRHTTIIENI